MTNYVPHNSEIVDAMLKETGLSSLNDLYADVPKKIQLQSDLELPEGLSEPDLLKHVKLLSKKNHIYNAVFRGGGSYYHYIPSLVDFVISRPEFYTAYTPYQPEKSQGTLQAIYEYQTAISRLTGMDVANASMYDGSTALAEAAITSTFYSRKKKVLMLEGIHPHYIEVVKTYLWGRDIELKIIEEDKLDEEINDSYASLLFQSPNFFGDILDVQKIAEIVHTNTKRCLVVQSMQDPTCLGILKSPGS